MIIWVRALSGGPWTTRVVADPGADSWFNDLIAVPGGLLALGGHRSDGQSDARAWTSVDGLTWKEVAP